MYRLNFYIRLFSISMLWLFTCQNALAVSKFIPTTSLAGIDATNLYYNPAGQGGLANKQFVFIDNSFISRNRFEGVESNPGLSPTGAGAITQRGHAMANTIFTIPAFYFSTPITRRLGGAATLTYAPYLSKTFSQYSMMRYDDIKVFEKSVDLSLSLGYKYNSKFSLGVGVDEGWVYDYSKIAARSQPFTTNDSFINSKTASFYNGWHTGLLYKPVPFTTIAFAYHSGVTAYMRGTSQFYTGKLISPALAGVLPPTIRSGNTKIVLPFPSYTTLTLRQLLSLRWGGFITAQYVGWSVYKNQKIYNFVAPFVGRASKFVPRNFHDSWTLNLATWYILSPKFTIFGSAAHVGSPSPPSGRGIIGDYLPVWTFTMAGNYQIARQSSVALAYTYVLPSSGVIRQINTSPMTSTLVGTNRNFSNYITMQFSTDFG